ncbi:MAG TPA: MMPL family transporter [Deltaproteobacteria bacterium]|nr:MMPL family transporter [Deltaproteobacteria bacterium]HPR53726.1 MMPL family transporter [Deltaproteobacteria bacterium]HXK47592.1 MMPL family transporter [Deltaproteobacteria bacterium]
MNNETMNTQVTDSKTMPERFVAFLLRNRISVLSLIFVVTAIFGYYAWHLKVATDFISFYPPRHPFIKLYNEYRSMLGSANVMTVAVEVKGGGNIYNWKTIDKIDRITQAMLEIEGCNPAQLASITHPKLKNVEVTGSGIMLKPLIHPGIQRSELGLQEIKRIIYSNEGIRGFYVSPDDKSAAIYAGFWEEGWNPGKVYSQIQKIIKNETDAQHNIYITGYPALYAYIYSLAPQIMYMLIITLAVLISLLFYYFRTLQGILIPFFSAVISAIWGLGFASMMGYSLDPLILVVPLIISARLMSHSVQCMSRYYEEYLRLGDRSEAIISGYGEMLPPAALSTLCDAVGLLLISVATIPIMRNLGFFSSFWVMSILVTVTVLNPLILSFIKPPKEEKIKRQSYGRVYSKISRMLVIPSEGKGRWVVVGITALILIVGGVYTHNLKIGDTEAGSAILFPDHPYNDSFRFFNKHFVGATQLIIVAEGKEKGAIRNYDTLHSMEEFQRFMETEGGAGGTLTFNNLLKRVYRMFHEGNPKWEMIPDSTRDLAQIGYIIRNNAAPGEMDIYVDYSWTNASIICFYKSYNSDTIKNCIAKAREFIQKNKHDKVNYRLAGGLLGILYAVNEEVEYSYWVSLIVVFLACFMLCVIVFKSIKCGIILIVPLAVSQIITEVFMLVYGIDVNINSLPVAAIAVGIGINYGIYLLARINGEYAATGDYREANRIAMNTTGKTIVFTETTMLAGVFFMIFVNMKFQSEMGLLLSILMLLNMINALILIPVLATILKPKVKGGGLLQHH